MIVYLSIGGNIGNSHEILNSALELLETTPFIEMDQISSFYRTSPVNAENQNDYLNLVCRLCTSLDIHSLWEKIQFIEKLLGKKPKRKDEARPVDIDLLFYGDFEGKTEGLEIPHPRWKERLFVLIPLRELTTEIYGEKIDLLIDQLKDSKQSVIKENF